MDKPAAPQLPLAWRACSAFEGEDAPELIQQYVKAANEALEEIVGGVADERQKTRINELRMFLRILEEALGPRGTTRRTLVLQNRRGRPLLSRDELRHRMAAACITQRLVADGWKQEAAIAHVSDQLGITRTEIFKWLKAGRNLELGMQELYSE
jgi:hypothetical protein